jgi:hypothetical protein
LPQAQLVQAEQLEAQVAAEAEAVVHQLLPATLLAKTVQMAVQAVPQVTQAVQPQRRQQQ